MSDYLKAICKLHNSIQLQDFLPSSDKKIYHYTSPAGFQGIITNRTLRFTNRSFLNDYTEGVYVLDLCIENLDSLVPDDKSFREELSRICKKQKEKMNEENIYVYQCSFSLDRDNLSLWNYYTKGDSIRGYNLCFDVNQIQGKLYIRLNTGEKTFPLCGKVAYQKNKQLQIVKQIIDRFRQLDLSYEQNYKIAINLLVKKLLVIGTFFKMPCFEIEHEFRLVFDLNSDTLKYRQKGTDKPIPLKEILSNQKYFEKGGILIPCIDVEFESDALKGIGISPTLDFETTKSSIYRATEINFPQIKENKNSVYPSKIPVRY